MVLIQLWNLMLVIATALSDQLELMTGIGMQVTAVRLQTLKASLDSDFWKDSMD